MKKIQSILFVLAFLFCFPNFSNAESTSMKDFISKSQAQNTAKEYVDIVSQNSFESWKSITLQEPTELYDFDGILTSYLFEITNKYDKDQGYIIVSALPDFPGVVESTRTGSSPYKNIKNGDGIYVGPLLSFTKNNNTFKDLHSGEIVEKNELKNKGTLTVENVKELAKTTKDSMDEIVNPDNITDYSFKLMSEVPDFLWYKGCAPTSGANIVKYWDNNGYKNLVQDSTSGSYLIEVLARSQYMNTSSSGDTTVKNMKYGIKKYMNDRGYYPTLGDSATYNYHVSELKASRPTWVTTENHPVWDNHAMTGVGYEQFYNTSKLSWTKQLILHDTWDNTPREYYIKWSSYFDHVISIKL